jgi:hypothetical protein
MWLAEKTGGTINIPLFSLCCGKGKYILEPLRDIPDLIANLLNGTDAESREFRDNIRAYNNALGFTSLGCQLDMSVANSRGGAYCFRIHGSLYHRIGSFNPVEGDSPKFAQIYFHDSSNELRNRHSHNSHININTLEKLQNLMHEINPFVSDFKTMAGLIAENPGQISDISMVFRAEGSPDPRRYNAPTTSTEIGVLIVGGNGDNTNIEEQPQRDLVIRPSTGGFQRINELNQCYGPMCYVLLFPSGQSGWNIYTTSVSNSSTNVTAMKFYASRLMVRDDNSYLHLFGNLFQQYIVDQYAKVEQQRLKFIRHNQPRLHSHILSGLEDAARLDDGTTDLSLIGRRVILPSSFVGSARYMSQLYQDAISIVRKFGKPDLFVTFTCNPLWPEIQRELLFGQTAADRPDLCARVFDKKLNVLMNDLTKNRILYLERLLHTYMW